MQAGLLLPVGTHAVHAHRATQVPGRLRVRARYMHAGALPVRIQVPGGVCDQDQVPAALLLPQRARHQPDRVPDRVQVRQAGPVQRHRLPARHLRVLRGEAVVRPVPQGAVLPHGDLLGALPQGVLLSAGVVGTEAVPGGGLLPARFGAPEPVPGGQVVLPGVPLRVAVHLAPHPGRDPVVGTGPARRCRLSPPRPPAQGRQGRICWPLGIGADQIRCVYVCLRWAACRSNMAARLCNNQCQEVHEFSIPMRAAQRGPSGAPPPPPHAHVRFEATAPTSARRSPPAAATVSRPIRARNGLPPPGRSLCAARPNSGPKRPHEQPEVQGSRKAFEGRDSRQFRGADGAAVGPSLRIAR